MKILIGTTNPLKVKRFADMLSGCDVRLLTLSDLGITDETKENGKTPKENAANKAKFYGRYFDKVICNDSGLYFDPLPFEDERQPGWPIDSIFVNCNTGTYFVDKGDNKYDTAEENIMLGVYRKRLTEFLKKSFGIY